MKGRLLINCCLLCLPIVSAAQQASQETKIIELETKWTDAYKQHDIKTMTSLLAEDVIVTVEDGRTFGRIGYISHTADSSVAVEVAEESDLKVRMHGSVAIVTGAYHETGNAKGKHYEYRDRFTDTWMKGNNGQWLLIASQYSVPVQL